MKHGHKVSLIVVVLAALACLPGCQRMYYSVMETMGYPKRDLLVNRVEEARDAQETAKQQFKTALERFKAVLQFHGGDLQEKYDTLRAEYERSQAKAQAVHERIAAVEDVADALFDEWEGELTQYSNDALRRKSRKKLLSTRRHYQRLLQLMKRADEKIHPVIAAFRDQVLYLKHNLNAQAINSLQDELTSIEGTIAVLIKKMEASIQEADAFITAVAGES